MVNDSYLYVVYKNNMISQWNFAYSYSFTINKSYKVIKVIDNNVHDYGKSYIILNDNYEKTHMSYVLFEGFFIDLQTHRNDKLEKLGI